LRKVNRKARIMGGPVTHRSEKGWNSISGRRRNSISLKKSTKRFLHLFLITSVLIPSFASGAPQEKTKTVPLTLSSSGDFDYAMGLDSPDVKFLSPDDIHEQKHTIETDRPFDSSSAGIDVAENDNVGSGGQFFPSTQVEDGENVGAEKDIGETDERRLNNNAEDDIDNEPG
jgi:hypothetical protein